MRRFIFSFWKEEQVQTRAVAQLPAAVMTVDVFDRAKPSGLKNTENLQTEVNGKRVRSRDLGLYKAIPEVSGEILPG